jgi:small subunit ribosomal protein S18
LKKLLAKRVRIVTHVPLQFLMSTEAQPLNRSKTPLDHDFTDTEALSRYTTETGRIQPRKYTGLTARQQRHITKTIKRARSMLLMK